MTAAVPQSPRLLAVLAMLVFGTDRAVAFLGPAAPSSAQLRREYQVSGFGRPLAPNSSHPGGDGGGTLLRLWSRSTKEGDRKVLPSYFTATATVTWVQYMLDSFEHTFDQGMIDGLARDVLSPEEQAREVAVADVPIISHDFLRSADDPIFVYGNAAGLKAFGYTWEEFTALPSRKSCEEELQGERTELLQGVRELGEGVTPTSISGVRVTKTGERFKIAAAVWNVKDAQGHSVGQAARFAACD